MSFILGVIAGVSGTLAYKVLKPINNFFKTFWK